MQPILKVVDLEKTFGSVVAAQDINVDIPAGQTVGIIGANGAGKTTFVNMVTGYLAPSRGQILFEGEDIAGIPSRKLTQRGVCRSFQIAQVFPTQTARDNLLIAVGTADHLSGEAHRLESLDGDDRSKRVEHLLERYGLTNFSNLAASTMPQGARKLLDIAMAVTSSPRLILLDEPTSGVSGEDKFQIMDAIIQALRDDEMTILFVEHDMEIVGRFADRVLAFVDGTIIADGPPEEALADPRVRELIVGEHHGPGGKA